MKSSSLSKTMGMLITSMQFTDSYYRCYRYSTQGRPTCDTIRHTPVLLFWNDTLLLSVLLTCVQFSHCMYINAIKHNRENAGVR